MTAYEGTWRYKCRNKGRIQSTLTLSNIVGSKWLIFWIYEPLEDDEKGWHMLKQLLMNVEDFANQNHIV